MTAKNSNTQKLTEQGKETRTGLKLIAFLLYNTLKSSKLYFAKISQQLPMLIWLIILGLNDLPLLSSHLCLLLSESQRTRSYAIFFFFTIVY